MSKGMWDLKKLMFTVQGGLCFYCWTPMTADTVHKQAKHYATKDHVLPISHGGAADWTNTVLACLNCNRTKANRLPSEAERARHGHILALFNERVEIRRAEMEAAEAAKAQLARAEPAPTQPDAAASAELASADAARSENAVTEIPEANVPPPEILFSAQPEAAP